MPISQINWPTSARNRRDIYETPYISRWDVYGDRATVPIYKDESNYLQWNLDPFMLGCSIETTARSGSNCGNGKSEFPGTVYSLPYWIARYYSIL